MQLVLCDKLQRMSPCLRGCNTMEPPEEMDLQTPRPLLPVFLPSMVQTLGGCTTVVLHRDPTCLKDICGPTEVQVPERSMLLRPQL